MRATSLAEKFSNKYERMPWSGCWIWTGATYANQRYGVIGNHGAAHRVSWELHFGNIPENLCVCHRCDVGLCVNPDHLFLGTQKQNVADMMAKGRKVIGLAGQHGNHARGEAGGQAKIKWHAVKRLRARYDAGERNIAALSRAFGMSESQTRRIVWRQSWVSGNG